MFTSEEWLYSWHLFLRGSKLICQSAWCNRHENNRFLITFPGPFLVALPSEAEPRVSLPALWHCSKSPCLCTLSRQHRCTLLCAVLYYRTDRESLQGKLPRCMALGELFPKMRFFQERKTECSKHLPQAIPESTRLQLKGYSIWTSAPSQMQAAPLLFCHPLSVFSTEENTGSRCVQNCITGLRSTRVQTSGEKGSFHL